MITFIRTHPARIYAVAVAALALVAHYVPELPSALVLGLVAAVLGTGEAVQRAENAKTAGTTAAGEDEDQADGGTA
ncbi:hypothetical protein [Streptomyces spectabilis]|uniref:Uncharacterized protein n=1 Tax=Streptomyces spectabilis TaxID=68270 RepID=A0A5P2X4B7_STRST|nr:hypothetical protein [Streptomyces spectabilis]MBB5103335.1 hypothetical protein [Streptomyces spectabilis]MCI3902525.1 hypothetical protein [Streptomyces spectabilis]QEV59857.1 hypothetical protein CP982_14845 [Streptomyces spectabilis]GGV54243.1 hypothetical protein GCM10010245_85720 [Streptomyces spectabilis]